MIFHVTIPWTEQEHAQYAELSLQEDKAFDKIVAYLAAKSGCDDVASLPQKKIERLKAKAQSLAEAWEVAHTDEDDDESDDHEDEEDDEDEDDQDDAPPEMPEDAVTWVDPNGCPDDVWTNPDAAEAKLAGLDRDLLQLLARHHLARSKASGFAFKALMRGQAG